MSCGSPKRHYKHFPCERCGSCRMAGNASGMCTSCLIALGWSTNRTLAWFADVLDVDHAI